MVYNSVMLTKLVKKNYFQFTLIFNYNFVKLKLDLENMDYDYLFKFIIIGDMGNTNQ